MEKCNKELERWWEKNSNMKANDWPDTFWKVGCRPSYGDTFIHLELWLHGLGCDILHVQKQSGIEYGRINLGTVNNLEEVKRVVSEFELYERGENE